jgi:hypothetical protein
MSTIAADEEDTAAGDEAAGASDAARSAGVGVAREVVASGCTLCVWPRVGVPVWAFDNVAVLCPRSDPPVLTVLVRFAGAAPGDVLCAEDAECFGADAVVLAEEVPVLPCEAVGAAPPLDAVDTAPARMASGENVGLPVLLSMLVEPYVQRSILPGGG